MARKRTQSLPLSNSVVVDAEGQYGGLWLLWGSECKVEICHTDKHLIVADVQDQKDEWLLIWVYEDPSRAQNSSIWDHIDAFLEEADKPTFIIGNFNVILWMQEKQGGNATLSSPNRLFRDWVNRTELPDLGHQGPCFTWMNKRPQRANVSKRLDRALANVAWNMKYPKTGVFHLPMFNSDHMPILVRTKPKVRRSAIPFRTENWWLAREDFKVVCQITAILEGHEWYCSKSMIHIYLRWRYSGISVRGLAGPSLVIKTHVSFTQWRW